MSLSNRLRAQQATLNSRQRDFGLLVARCILVRTLRFYNLHYVLSGSPCVVGFVVPEPDDREPFVRATRMLLRERSRFKRETVSEILEWDHDKPTRRPREADLEAALTVNDRVFGFALDTAAFPAVFRLAADAVVPLLPVDMSALKVSARAAGLRSIPDDLLEKAIGQPLSLLGALLKPGRDLRHVIRSLDKIELPKRANSTPRPARERSLDDLHGLGDAAVWGRELAKDLGEFQAGRLSWADVDRGVLVSGPTGTGKTTFAQALAKTCGVPIHIHSLARWQARGYLNDLLKAMRGAFDAARASAPCILFLDELDSFGDRETLSGRNENYEREVINALLECLDGVEGREGVVVVGATNLPDKIDRAIRRPGRLGKHVQIPLPDAEARLGILRHHLAPDVIPEGLTDLAERLEGASGAVIEQVVRDARRKARSERRAVTVEDLGDQLPPRIVQSTQALDVTCVHEAGHALVGRVLGDEAGRKLIEARAFSEVQHDGSGGWTIFSNVPTQRRTKAAYLAQISILLAGIAAEDIVYGHYTDGAGGTEDSDLHQATLIAATMEMSLGLGGSLVYLSSSRPADVLSRLRVDLQLRSKVSGVLDECFQRAKDLIAERKDSLDEILRLLKDRGSASAAEIEAVIDPEQFLDFQKTSKNALETSSP